MTEQGKGGFPYRMDITRLCIVEYMHVLEVRRPLAFTFARKQPSPTTSPIRKEDMI